MKEREYIKLPIPVKASQWFRNGDHPHDYDSDIPEPFADREPVTAQYRRHNNWEGEVVRYFRHPSFGDGEKCAVCGHINHAHGWIDTKEGGHRVCPGDWILTGIEGERWPVKPHIFEKTYALAPTGDKT